jgi:glutathione S-transferase
MDAPDSAQGADTIARGRLVRFVMSPSSPYARKVRILIRAAGLQDAITEHEVTATPLQSGPQALAANTLGRIPALIRAEGPTLYDSRVIGRYIDSLSDVALYPEAHRWEVLTLGATAKGILGSAVPMTCEFRLRVDGA